MLMVMSTSSLQAHQRPVSWLGVASFAYGWSSIWLGFLFFFFRFSLAYGTISFMSVITSSDAAQADQVLSPCLVWVALLPPNYGLHSLVFVFSPAVFGLVEATFCS